MRGMLLILLALFIDGLQALLSAAFFALGSVLTAATPVGAAIGCGAAGVAAVGVKTGVVAAATCFASSPFGIPIGIAMGFATDFCISATLGAGLILVLVFNGMFYRGYAFGGGFFELIPGLDVLPGWTLMTVLCVIRKAKEEGKLAGTAAGAFATLLAPNTFAGSSFRAVKEVNQSRVNLMKRDGIGYAIPEQEKEARVAARQRLSTNLKGIDGIAPKPNPSTAPRTRYAA